jgi:elongin-A
MEAVERKKEREVKYTDRVPPPKRIRTGCTDFNYLAGTQCLLFHSGNTSVQAKSLFQKTRSEASKLQKTIYNARVLPPMPTAKGYGIAPQMAIASSSGAPSRVTVNTVIKRRPASAPLTLPTLRNVTSETALSAKSGESEALPTPQPVTTTTTVSSPPADTSQASEPSRVAKSPSTNKILKKDPMASLFVPKHKAYSQRPV